MERGIITISKNGVVGVPSAPIWMTQFEIADFFGVFSSVVRKAIQSIYKNKELNEVETQKYIRQTDGISYDVYNFEMVVAVAFRICSRESILFRKFVVNEICITKKEASITFPVAEEATDGIIEFIPSGTCSRCSDAKVAHGSDGSDKVKRQSRSGYNLPPLECILSENLAFVSDTPERASSNGNKRLKENRKNSLHETYRQDVTR